MESPTRRIATTSKVTLENWEALAPLNEQEKRSVTLVQTAASERPLPPRLAQKASVASGIPSRPGTPSNSGLLRKIASRTDVFNASGSPTSSPRPSTTAVLGGPSGYGAGGSQFGTPRTRSPHPHPLSQLQDSNTILLPFQPVQTTQQFHDYYSLIERSIERDHSLVYLDHLAEVEGFIDDCEVILDQLQGAMGLVRELEANAGFVEECESALRGACERLLDEQKYLENLANSIASRLEYFRELESAQRLLNLPGESLVLQDDFLTMLERLDVCIDFLKTNRNYKDAEIYLIRFQQCLTRSMTLIKMYFFSVIKSLNNEVSERTGNKDLPENALHALLYTKFSSSAHTTQLQILLHELTKRATRDPEDYLSLLQECYATWFGARGALVGVELRKEVNRLDLAGGDISKLARAGCNYLRTVCLDEWNLFRDYFTMGGEEDIYSYLESLCDHLYDSLRPRILHEQKLDSLCELCTILHALMALDAEDDDDDDEGGDEQGNADGRQANPQTPRTPTSAMTVFGKKELGRKRLQFAPLLRPILQDTQTRLVFRSQAVVQSEVLGYVPKPADLDYPAILKGKIGGSTREKRDEEEEENVDDALFRLPSVEIQETWYPTLRKTLWVLSRLHTYVNNAIFEDFAGEAVALCRQSLSSAALQIAVRPESSRLDAQLFSIRHLLILKEMVRSIDLVQIDRAVDFSSVTDALGALLRNTSALFSPNALLRIASKGIPNFAETIIHAKTDLDGELKRVCEEFITHTSHSLTAPLQSFLDQCTSFLSTTAGAHNTAGKEKDLSSEPWATPEKVKEIVEEFMHGKQTAAGDKEKRDGELDGKGLRKGMEITVDRLRIYLDDVKTIAVLVPPMQDGILTTYTAFYNLVKSEYGFSTSVGLPAPNSLRNLLDDFPPS